MFLFYVLENVCHVNWCPSYNSVKPFAESSLMVILQFLVAPLYLDSSSSVRILPPKGDLHLSWGTPFPIYIGWSGSRNYSQEICGSHNPLYPKFWVIQLRATPERLESWGTSYRMGYGILTSVSCKYVSLFFLIIQMDRKHTSTNIFLR